MAEPIGAAAQRAWLAGLLQRGTARRLRERIGMSQTELAHELGATLGSVHRWETGKGVPRDLPVVVRWLDVLSMIERELGDVPTTRPAASLRRPRRSGSEDGDRER